MEFVTIMKAATEISVLLLCAAVVIWQTINDRNRQTDREKEYSQMTQGIIDKLKEQNDTMLQEILHKVDTGHMITSEEDRDITKIEKEIEAYIAQILKETGANRVALFRYHNGGKDYNGRSFLRMSMTNETVSGGTLPIQQQSQNLFRSVFFGLVHSLEDNGYDYINDVEEIQKTDAGFYHYLNDFGIKSKYTFALYNTSKTIIGFITIDFATPGKEHTDIVLECMQDKKIKIETLLNL